MTYLESHLINSVYASIKKLHLLQEQYLNVGYLF